MDEEGFRSFVAKGKRVRPGLTEESIRSNLQMIGEFEEFLSNRMPEADIAGASEQDFSEFAAHLAQTGRNTEENLIGVLRYARFINNKDIEREAVKMLDGATVMNEISEIVKKRLGPEVNDELFDGVEIPVIGSPIENWPQVTKTLMERMESKLDENAWKGVLLAGPHTGPDEYYLPEKKKFEESEDMDDYLAKRSAEFIALLKQHMDEDTLFFNQEIDEAVLDFVRSNKEIGGGVREGDIIYETKIPYMAKEYLREKDPRMKRYYYCHCPWVREAIRSGLEVSPNFCYCSASYHKKHLDVIFGQPVEVEVVESVLKGDTVCRFAMRIPKQP